MQWHSVKDFLAMGGYAFYVWGSFGITFCCMAIELLMLQSRRQRIMQAVKQEAI
ncbi:MAG: heme exporter protein CcmD [Bdellovibrio sp.]|nr:heme exporter protein CcmD [Methylotenera sp.]